MTRLETKNEQLRNELKDLEAKSFQEKTDKDRVKKYLSIIICKKYNLNTDYLNFSFNYFLIIQKKNFLSI